MIPSRPQRRLIAVLACVVSLLLPQAGASADDRAPLREGEAGSGPPGWTAPRTLQRVTDVKWSDVPQGHWARRAIDHVGAAHGWMRDYKQAEDGTYPFRPENLETRRHFARSVVRALGKDAVVDPGVTFADLPEDDRFYPFANVAVANGWLHRDAEDNFRPLDPVTMADVHRALVLVLGLGDLAAGADALHMGDGTAIDVPKDFGTTLIGMRLGLRFNHGDETLDVPKPSAPLSRAEVAWSLYRATTVPSYVASGLAPYADMELPNLSDKMSRVVTFAVRYVGYPYVWGGEWAEARTTGYCCGYQPIGGFDCSGLTWWVMKRAAAGWDNTPPREYRGWDLPQRTSAQMAAVGGRVRWDDLQPGDLLLYDGNGDGTVDHVDTYIGGGWAIDSGSSNGGVTLTYVRDNWYEDHFVKGRRIVT
ncbi:MAG TPA: C40 family peptidase [Actinomycetota bacterium]|nr:C40 family peptidase [Actinomycetota bacterium]